MTKFKTVTPKKIIMGKLSFGCDLLEELTKVANESGVRLGRIEAIGAVQKARIGFYNQNKHKYQFHLFNQPQEIVKLAGNISMKDGKPFVHAHVTLADKAGKSYGGHLAEGTIVFACEFVLEAFEGPEFSRRLDKETGLSLWSL